MDQSIKSAALAVRAADALLVAAGAGMGVDSGLPDFRGNGGFWKAYPMAEKLGLSFSALADPRWFDRDPRLAWGFYGHRLNLYRTTIPHSGFRQFLEVGEAKPEGYFVYTSNVDGQFQTAGYAIDKIVECHGSIHHLQCVEPCSDAVCPADHVNIDVDEDTFIAHDGLPTCSLCGQLARPNILMFNDAHWISRRTEQQEQRLYHWLERLMEDGANLAMIELGAGTAVPTVRRKSELLATNYGTVTLIRINPREPQVPDGHISIPLGAKEGLARIVGAM